MRPRRRAAGLLVAAEKADDRQAWFEDAPADRARQENTQDDPGLHVIDTGPIRPGSLDPKRPARRLAARPDGVEVGQKHRRLSVGRDPGASDARAADRAEGRAHDIPRVVLRDDRHSRAGGAELFPDQRPDPIHPRLVRGGRVDRDEPPEQVDRGAFLRFEVGEKLARPGRQGVTGESWPALERFEEWRHLRERLQVRLDVRLGVLDRNRPLLVRAGRLRDDSLVQHRQVPGL